MNTTLLIAILGLVLGIINTFTTVYKEFLKKPPTPLLDIYCDYAYWRYNYDKTQCQVLIDLTVVPRIQANSIKKIVFINKEHTEFFGNWGDEINYVTFYKIEENIYGKHLFLKHNYEELRNVITGENKDSRRDVRNINLPLDFAYSFSLCEQFEGVRLPDGYEDIPSSGWWVQIFDSYNNCFEQPVEFYIVSR